MMKIRGFRYNSPATQVVLVALVCFATVGMFLALLNLGAGGTQNIVLSDITNATLYALFSITGLVAGSINNVCGPRVTLFLGTLGYAFYVSGLWVYQSTGVQGYLIFTGIVQGIGAALLWTAQGAIMMAYPLEKDKGRMFSVFWMIFNSGSLLGGIVALGINLGSNAVTGTPITLYIVFFVIIMVGVALTWTLLPPGKVVRSDGTVVSIDSYTPIKVELRGMWEAIKTWQMMMIAPMCFVSNYIYSYQSAFAFKLFDAQTRALNAVTSALGQIIGALIIGLVLDGLPLKTRSRRGLAGIVATLAMATVSYGWGLHYQLTFTRETAMPLINFRESLQFGTPIALLILYSVVDAMFQGMAYWIMGAITNDAFRLARYAGVYKCIQAAGSAISFGVDAAKTPLLNEQVACMAMVLFALFPAAYVVSRVKDTNTIAEPPTNVEDAEAIHALEEEKKVEKQAESVVDVATRRP